MVDNIKRDPFEGSVGDQMKSLFGQAGALAGRVTAYMYDWNIIPHRPGPVAEGTGILRGLPADAGSGELQPDAGPPAN
jgi:hypothetical protein